MPPRGRKRKAPAETAAVPATPAGSGKDLAGSRRRSGRISSSGNKSHYFEEESSSAAVSGADDDGERQTKRAKSNSGAVKGRPRGRPRKQQMEEESDGDDYKTEADEEEEYGDENGVEDDGENEDGSESEKQPVKSRNLKHVKRKANHMKKNEDEEEEFDENAPPEVTFIPLPKLRDVGKTLYADDRLHPNTVLFLADLKMNNQRSWLKSNDEEYRRSLKDWETYVATIQDKIIGVDETIPELPFKDVNFRIYRDVRFSKNPDPYKTHYGAAFSRTGRKGPYACYYIHCEPGHAFVGGGLWHPEADAVARLRASIDERPARWRRVLLDPAFRETFLSPAAGASGKGKAKGKREGDEYEIVKKAFAEHNQENALKTKPKGFHPDHRDIELLKLRNFTVTKRVADDIFTSKDGQEKIVEWFRAMVRFVTHLNRTVMPDPGDEDDSDEDDAGDE